MKYFVIWGLAGIAALFALGLWGGGFGCGLPISRLSIAAAGLLGLPGVGCMLIFSRII